MLLDEIAKLLQDNSIATVDTDLFKGAAPATPHTCTTLYETPGIAPTFCMSTAPVFEQAGLQVISRSTNYKTARNKAESIYRRFIGTGNATLKPTSTATGTKYLNIEAVQTPFYLGIDDNKRHMVSCNYLVWKQLST